MDQFVNTVRDVLLRHPHVQLAMLFGSRASGRHTPTSDLDVAVAADHPLSAAEKIALIDDLAVQAGCAVDLVDLTAVSGPILQQALSKGSVLLNRKPGLRAKLMLKMWYNQADMMPYYNRIVTKRVEGFAHG